MSKTFEEEEELGIHFISPYSSGQSIYDNIIKPVNDLYHSLKESKVMREKLKEINEGKNLEKYLYDEDKYIRAAVARYGYGLDILINDDSPVVREEVAFKEYGLDILINDIDNEVRHTAFSVLHSIERNDVIMNYEDTIRLLNGLNIEERKGSFQIYIVNLNTSMEYSYGGHDYNVLVANTLQQIMDIIQYQLDDENTSNIYYDESYIFIPNYTNKMIKLEYFVKWFKEEKK